MTCSVVWQPPGTRPTPHNPSTITSASKLLVVGDSIAAMVKPSIVTVLSTYYSKTPTILDYGIGGSAIARGVGDVDWVAQIGELLDELTPTHVIAHFLGSQGTNDETVQRSNAFLDVCKANGVPVAWMIPYRLDPAIFSSEACDAVDAAADAYLTSLTDATWRPNLRAVMMPTAYSACVQNGANSLTTMLADGIHPAPNGCTVIADAVVSSIA